MVRVVDVLWLLSAAAVFGAPLRDDQGELDINQLFDPLLPFNKSYDESLESNEITPEEVVKPGHSAKEKELKEIETDLNLKPFNVSYDESLGSNEITPEEVVKPVHSAKVKPEEVLKEREMDLDLKVFNKSYDESLRSNEIKPQEFVKPGHTAKVKLDDLLKEIRMDFNLKFSNKSHGEPLEIKEITSQELVKPGHSAKVKPEEVLKERENDGNVKPLNITYKKTSVKNYTKDINNEIQMEKFKKHGHPDESEPVKILLLKKLFNPFADMDLLLKHQRSWPYKDLNKDRRVISTKWKPIVNTRIFMSTHHPHSLQTEQEDPITFYLLHDPNFLGCSYVPVGPRVSLAEELMESLFRPTLYPRITARNNLRKYQREYVLLPNNSENLFPDKSDKDLEDKFKCPEENGSFPLEGHCSTYIMCQDGIPHVNYCPPELRYNPRVNNCDLASKVNCGHF